jgi:hypothetical protein
LRKNIQKTQEKKTKQQNPKYYFLERKKYKNPNNIFFRKKTENPKHYFLERKK